MRVLLLLLLLLLAGSLGGACGLRHTAQLPWERGMVLREGLKPQHFAAAETETVATARPLHQRRLRAGLRSDRAGGDKATRGGSWNAADDGGDAGNGGGGGDVAADETAMPKGPLLGYVTPWNGGGKEWARVWRGKFDLLAPVWYTLQDGDARNAAGDAAVELDGKQDVDEEWLQALREPLDNGDASASAASDAYGEGSCPAVWKAMQGPGQTVDDDDEEEDDEEEFESLSGDGEVEVMRVERPSPDHGGSGAADADEPMLCRRMREGQPLPGAPPVAAPKIVPRVVWSTAATKRGQPESAARLLVEEMQRLQLDGFVFELGALKEMQALVAASTQIRDANPQAVIVLVIPPVTSDHTKNYVRSLMRHTVSSGVVDYFSLMTYDYSKGQVRGPNAPLHFVEKNLQTLLEDDEDEAPGSRRRAMAHRILTGIPFYGYEDGQPMIHVQIQERMRRKPAPKIRWNTGDHEHEITYTKNGQEHYITYPTLAFIQDRLALAESYGTGVSIWELGQGLPYFFDLL